MATYVRAANPIWWLPDHTGVSLNDEYYAFFLTNTLPYIPQAVYSTPNGTQYSNPIEFSPAGTLPDNLYFDPSLVYRIEIRHGNTQADELIWEINNFVPGNGSTAIISDQLVKASNIITNPQFADIFFVSPFTYTQIVAGTYTLPIGPGWDLVLTGTGTTTVTQVAVAGTGTSGAAGNPPYYLDINNSGWTTAKLRQRLSNNGAIFSGGAVAVALDAASVTTAHDLTVTYSPNGTTGTNIFQQSIPTGSLIQYTDAIDIPDSTNSNSGEDAYVNIDLVLPGTGEMLLSNIQIVGQSSPLSSNYINPTDNPAFQEVTYEQVVNNEFNVYRDSLVYQAKDTILVGWDFPLNPWQFTTKTRTITSNKIDYYADQTIVYEKNGPASVTIGASGDTQNQGFTVTAVDPSNQFIMIQYIDPATVRPYWSRASTNERLSSMVNVYLNTAVSSRIPIKVKLIYRTDLPSAISNTEPIASWTLTDPVLAAGWTEIEAENFIAQDVVEGPNVLSFNGFQLPEASTDTMTLGIMVYTTADMESDSPFDSMVFQDISLVPNEFAMPSNPKTFDQVLKECQFYYEKSYNNEILPGANSEGSMIMAFQSVYFDSGPSEWIVRGAPFNILFNTIKRAAPTITFYVPIAGTAANVTVNVYVAGVTNNTADVPVTHWTLDNASSGTKGAYYESNDGATLVASGLSTASASATGLILFQYTADARLGV